METKKYVIMETHRKFWRYLFMTENMESERNFWIILLLQSLNVFCLFGSAMLIEGIKGKIEISGPPLCCAGGMCSYIFTFIYHDTIFDIVSNLQEHYEKHKESSKNLAIILACHDESNRMLTVFSVVTASSGVSLTSKPVFIFAFQLLTCGEAELMLPFPAAYPWESSGLGFYVSFALQLSLIVYVVLMVISNVSTSVFFSMAIVSQLQLTQERFREITEDCSEEEEDMRLLKVALKSHQEALKLIEAVESVESVKVFSQVFSTAIALSMCMFMISRADGDLSVIVSFALMANCVVVQLALLCFYGQKVINEVDKLYAEIYAVPWYNHSKYFKSCIVFSLMRAGRNDRLTAWSFADMSMETFNRVMTTAFSYVTFLQTMSE